MSRGRDKRPKLTALKATRIPWKTHFSMLAIGRAGLATEIGRFSVTTGFAQSASSTEMQFWTSEIEKQVGQRLQIVMNDPQLMSVFQKFGGETFRRSSIFHGLGQFLREREVSGRCCFEVGTWNGLTAVVLSRFFEEVVTVDIAHNAAKHEIIDHLGIKNIRCIDIRDNEHKLKIAASTEFDFAYLDGDHANDTPLDWGMTRHCGRVLFHEVWPFQNEVFSLVHSLPPHQVVHNGMGLALWDEGMGR